MKPEIPSVVGWTQKISPVTTITLAVLLTLALGLGDYLTPASMSFIPLHMLIIGAVGWLAGGWWASFIGALSLGAIGIVYWARRGWDVEVSWIMVWNGLFDLVAFAGAAWLTAAVRRTGVMVEKSERKFRQLHESMIDAFVSVDMSGRLTDFNRAYQQLLGYPAEELRTKTYVDLTPEKWHAFETRVVQDQILARGYSDVYEKEYRRRDGSVFPVELRTSVIRGETGEPVAMWAIVRDVTERHRAAEALRQARDHLEERVRERTAELEAANTALRLSGERYRSLVNSLNVGVFRVTPGREGVFMEANPTLARIHGYDSVDELLRVKVADLYLDPEVSLPDVEELFRTGQIFDYEMRLKRKDGRTIYAQANATAHRGADGRIDWIDGVLEDVTERRHLERQILEISDDEQARIGQDLHDGLCQELIGLALDASLLAAELEQSGRSAQDRGLRLVAGLDRAITEARQLSRGLFPVRLEGANLGSALEQLAQGVARRFAVECRFEQRGELTVPEKTVGTQLYRIAQEAMNNAAKHSRGSHIRVRLLPEPGRLVLEVEDDGTGMGQQPQAGGMGLHIMRYRARSIGGNLSITPGAEGGTVVRCRVGAGQTDVPTL